MIAKSLARIHRRNLINFGVIPLLFADDHSYDGIEADHRLVIQDPVAQLEAGAQIQLHNQTSGETLQLHHDLSADEIATLKAGGLINKFKADKSAQPADWRLPR